MTELPAHPDTEHGPEPDGGPARASIRPSGLNNRGKTFAVSAAIAVIALIVVLHLTGVVGQ